MYRWINPFTPIFLKWHLPTFNLDMFVNVVAIGVTVKDQKQNDTQYIDPDKTVRNGPSHLDLRCLQR